MKFRKWLITIKIIFWDLLIVQSIKELYYGLRSFFLKPTNLLGLIIFCYFLISLVNYLGFRQTDNFSLILFIGAALILVLYIWTLDDAGHIKSKLNEYLNKKIEELEGKK